MKVSERNIGVNLHSADKGKIIDKDKILLGEISVNTNPEEPFIAFRASGTTEDKMVTTVVSAKFTTDVIGEPTVEKGVLTIPIPKGAQGLQGEKGPQGAIGETGDQGPQGNPGGPGPKGSQGNMGKTGDQGFQGVQGIDGVAGARGPQGSNGDKGFQGVQGVVGAQGPQGSNGDKGFQGAQGIDGVAGARGSKGAQGAIGATGEIVTIGKTSANTTKTYVISHTDGTSAAVSFAQNEWYRNIDVYIQDGAMHAQNGFYQDSDIRLKNFGDDININFNDLASIPKKHFEWKDDKYGVGQQIGTSAQALLRVYPELVTRNDDGYYTVNYAGLSIVALAAIDKLWEEIERLKASK